MVKQTAYSLDREAKAFTYQPKDLFDCISRIIAHPHTSVTKHDRARAMAIFLTLQNYLDNYTQTDCDGAYVIYESDSVDFEAFVMEQVGQEAYGVLRPEEVLQYG